MTNKTTVKKFKQKSEILNWYIIHQANNLATENAPLKTRLENSEVTLLQTRCKKSQWQYNTKHCKGVSVNTNIFAHKHMYSHSIGMLLSNTLSLWIVENVF